LGPKPAFVTCKTQFQKAQPKGEESNLSVGGKEKVGGVKVRKGESPHLWGKMSQEGERCTQTEKERKKKEKNR